MEKVSKKNIKRIVCVIEPNMLPIVVFLTLKDNNLKNVMKIYLICRNEIR